MWGFWSFKLDFWHWSRNGGIMNYELWSGERGKGVGCRGIMNYELWIGEVGKWGNWTKTPKPQPPTPKTWLLSPDSYLHGRCGIFAGVLFFDKNKQNLFIDSTNLKIFKLTFRNIYKFLRINWERFLFNNDVIIVTAILLNFIMGYSVLFWAAMVETLATPRRWS